MIYPHVCGICGKIDKYALCKKCEKRLRSQGIGNIEDYTQSTSYFNEHMYLFHYNGEIREAILNYKFNQKPYIYETFLKFLKNNEKMCVQLKKYDIIMAVPISWKREKQRGYNQSNIIAKQISKMLDLKYLDKILIKIKHNKVQSTLSKEERIKNVKGVYKILHTNKIADKNILLVDDIFTTGNTVDECSKILKKAGVKDIGVFTIAKD